MAVESKPLFHPEVIRQHVRSFKVPERVDALMPKLQHWAELIASGRADDFKETDLLPDFITDIFCNLLGYTRPAGPGDTFTLSRETRVEVDGKFADAVLGRFHKDTYKAIVAADPGCADLLKRFLRGQDFSRWRAESQGSWMITLESSENRDWPWSALESEAEAVFRTTYPAIYAHLDTFKNDLQKRQDQGRYWWELRSCADWAAFEKPKIMFPEIT